MDTDEFYSLVREKKNRNQSVPTAPVSTGTRSRTRTRRDICTGTNRITDAGGTREAIGEGDQTGEKTSSVSGEREAVVTVEEKGWLGRSAVVWRGSEADEFHVYG